MRSLYQDFLFRNPSNAEVQPWLNSLAAGTSTYAVAIAFATSTERDVDVIVSYYQYLLGRPPETNAVVTAGVNNMQHGLTRLDLAVNIVASDEYYLRSGNTNQNFIVRAYQNIVHRTPDSELWLAEFTDLDGNQLALMSQKTSAAA